jgi:hypothetical protein
MNNMALQQQQQPVTHLHSHGHTHSSGGLTMGIDPSLSHAHQTSSIGVDSSIAASAAIAAGSASSSNSVAMDSSATTPSLSSTHTLATGNDAIGVSGSVNGMSSATSSVAPSSETLPHTTHTVVGDTLQHQQLQHHQPSHAHGDQHIPPFTEEQRRDLQVLVRIASFFPQHLHMTSTKELIACLICLGLEKAYLENQFPSELSILIDRYPRTLSPNLLILTLHWLSGAASMLSISISW